MKKSLEEQKVIIQKLDNEIRGLLHFYHIDDSDLIEVDDGPIHRLVLVHPERPLPRYIQENKQILQQLQSMIYRYYFINMQNSFLNRSIRYHIYFIFTKSAS